MAERTQEWADARFDLTEPPPSNEVVVDEAAEPSPNTEHPH